MKLKRIIFLILILTFIIFLPSIIFLISNLFFKNNFIFANNINKNLELIFKNNNLLKFKKADYFYKMLEFEKAYKKYKEIDCKTEKQCFLLNHNLWNTMYKIWDKKLNNIEKFNYWQKSLSYYLKALNIKYDLETKKNYDFVLEKLNKLRNETEKQNRKNNQENNNFEWNDNKKSESNQNDIWKNNIIPKWQSIEINDKELKSQKPLSKEEEEKIHDYLNNLREEEKQNIELNKQNESYKDIFDILEYDFFTPFDKKDNDW